MDSKQYHFLKEIDRSGSYTDDYYNRTELFASSVREKYLSNEFSDNSDVYLLTSAGRSAIQEYKEKYFQLNFTTITAIIALLLSIAGLILQFIL